MITTADIDRFFVYRPPTQDQVRRYVTLRDAAREFAEIICAMTPAGPDQTAAIRKLRETVMTANAAIACSKPGDI